jgi:TolB-like protein/Flp pilus assembly protein TadD
MPRNLLARLRERGVLRVAASYAVIAWLALQIADVTFDPLGIPKWVLTSLIVVTALGFPVAIALAWFYEIGDEGIQRDTAAEGVARPSVHGRRRYMDVVIIGVLLVVIAVLLVKESGLGKPPRPPNPAIAVLAFENLSGDPKQEYFSDGLAVEVLDRLGRVPGLRVIASSSSFSYKGKNQDAKTIASQLGVTTVLEGSVRRAGTKLKFSAKLIDGMTGYQIWSGSFDREVTDVFAVQAELAAAVIDAIVPAARGDTAPTRPPTMDLDAHDHYLLGLAAQRARTGTRLAESVAHLEQAVSLDPSYAEAHAALARSLMLLAGYGYAPSDDTREPLRRAEQAVYKALSLNPSLSDAHGALGNLLRQTGRPGAEDEYKRALELNPNNAIVAHYYAVLLSDAPDRRADAEAMSERALQLDPRSAIDWTNKLAQALDTKGFDAYRAEFAKALQIFAGDADGLMALGLVATDASPYEAYQLSVAIERAGGDRTTVLLASLGALIAVGNYDECLARIDRIRSGANTEPLGFAPWDIRAAGLKGDSQRLDHALANPGRSRVDARYRFMVDAYWYTVQGRLQEAAAALAKAGEFEQVDNGIMGASLDMGSLPAVMLIYKADGRDRDAQALLERFHERLRKQLGGRVPNATENMLLAEVAIVDGQRASAVRHLQAAMKLAPLPDRFYPELPWLRSLEGEPGYAELVAELEKRRAAIRAQIVALDAASGARVQ